MQSLYAILLACYTSLRETEGKSRPGKFWGGSDGSETRSGLNVKKSMTQCGIIMKGFVLTVNKRALVLALPHNIQTVVAPWVTHKCDPASDTTETCE